MRRPVRYVAWLPLAAALLAMNGTPSAAPAPVALPLDPAASRLTFTDPGGPLGLSAGRSLTLSMRESGISDA